MTKWRPEGWDIVDYLPMNQYCEHVLAITNAFEVGADAILEELCTDENRLDCIDQWGTKPPQQRKGWLVFIEEEK